MAMSRIELRDMLPEVTTMQGLPVPAAECLDQRYLDFSAGTSHIFTQIPELEPLRHFIFKELLIQRHSYGAVDRFKHWLRPLLQRDSSRGVLERADVLLWVESSREVIVEALVPIYRALVACGIRVQLASSGGPMHLPASNLDFCYPARAVAPGWAKNAWQMLCDEIEELRDRSLAQTFSYACAQNQGRLDEVNRILDAVKPGIVIAASTQLSGGAALLTCARSRALSLLLQHGILQPFYTPVLADYMITWGQSSNNFLTGLGVPQETLVALGSPRHDSMRPSNKADTRAKLAEALSLPRRPTFVFFSNGNDLVRNGIAPLECASWLESMAAHYANAINVVVRLHPNEDGSLYRNCPHLTLSKATPDFGTTLQGCNWVGSLCSTVLYDALLYRKPIWQFYADGWPPLADNWQHGLARRVSSATELEEMLGQALANDTVESPDETLIDQVFANHGSATKQVTHFIQTQLEKVRPGPQREFHMPRLLDNGLITGDFLEEGWPISNVTAKADPEPSNNSSFVV
jgi:hypothetical protein